MQNTVEYIIDGFTLAVIDDAVYRAFRRCSVMLHVNFIEVSEERYI